MAIAYGLIFALSLIMLPLYFAFIRKKQNEPWLLGLFLVSKKERRITKVSRIYACYRSRQRRYVDSWKDYDVEL